MSEYTSRVVIGMDLGDKKNHMCVLDSDGEKLEEVSVMNKLPSLSDYFSRFDDALVVMEAGTHSPWIYHFLNERGFDVLVGNPRKLRAIWTSTNKSDIRDAEMLARIGRFDPKLLYPIQHRGREAHTDLAILKSRDALVKCRTDLINHIRSVVKSHGGRLPKCSSESFCSSVTSHLPEPLLPAIIPLINTLLQLNQKIKKFDLQIEELSDSYSETKRLRKISGVGPITALAYVLIIEEVDRFNTSRNVGPFLGLTPKRDQSGTIDKKLRISKAGNEYLRRLLVSCSQYIMGPLSPDCDLKRFGERIVKNNGGQGKKKAVVAVARKVAVLLHSLWKNQSEYQRFYKAEKKKKAA